MEATHGFGTFLTQVLISAMHRGIQAVPCASQFNPQLLRFVSYKQISRRNLDLKIRLVQIHCQLHLCSIKIISLTLV